VYEVATRNNIPNGCTFVNAFKDFLSLTQKYLAIHEFVTEEIASHCLKENHSPCCFSEQAIHFKITAIPPQIKLLKIFENFFETIRTVWKYKVNCKINYFIFGGNNQ
jgi:hypothetical protein